MKNVMIGLLALIALATSGWTVYRQFQKPSVSVTVGEDPDDITYICTESGDLTRGEWQPTPALSLKTGRKTLMQALYCAKCRSWYPAPPAEMAQQSPRGPACPKDGSSLTVEEPVEDAEESGG